MSAESYDCAEMENAAIVGSIVSIQKGNPSEFFDLMTKVLTVEEIDHPFHAHKTALQEEELAPLMVVQLPNVERWCGSTELSENGRQVTY